MKVLGEGVETDEQRVLLRLAGCDELQGFLFAKPMTARALLLWAMDDQKQHTDGFATSLFVSTIKGALGEPRARAALHLGSVEQLVHRVGRVAGSVPRQ